MPVNLTNMDIGTRYALQEDFNNGFVGRDRQVVIQTDDPKGYRPVIMDGQTTGGKSKVALVADLTDYLPKANPAFTGTLSGAKGTFTGDISGTNGTFTGTLSLKGDPVATQSELLTEGPTLQQTEIDNALTSLGVYGALEDLITEYGGTVPMSLSENSVQTMSAEPEDPWDDLV